MKDLPRNLRFDHTSTAGVLRVSYVQPPATVKDEARVLGDPLDLWGVSWILNHDWPARVVDVRVPRGLSRARWRTLLLRLTTLQDCLQGFTFLVDGSARWAAEAAEIRSDIRHGLFLTCDRSNLHRDARPGKETPETRVESWIPEHAKKFLAGAFPHGLKRGFPAIVYKASLNDQNRATTRQWIDLLGVDGEGRLSTIALKVGDDLPMGQLAQGIDQAIYCQAFRSHLQRNWFPDVASEHVALYLVADRFPPGLLAQEGTALVPFSSALRPDGWLDLILVQIDSAGLPAGLSERVVFPAAALPC